MIRKIKMTFILFMSVFLLCLSVNYVWAQNSAQEEKLLKFDIEFEKTVFKEGQPVKCIMVLANTGKSPLIVNKRFLVNRPFPMPHEVYFVIKDEKGNELFFQLMIRAGEPKSGDFVELPGGRNIKNSDIFGIIESKGYDLTKAYDLKKPGVYTVSAVYENRTEPEGMKVWTGRLISNTVKITIKK